MTNPPFRPGRTNGAKTPSYATSTGSDRFTMFRGGQAADNPAARKNHFGAGQEKQRKWNGGADSGRASQLPWIPSKPSTTATTPLGRQDRRLLSRHVAGTTAMGGIYSPGHHLQQQPAEKFNRFGNGAGCDLQFEVWNFASPSKSKERPKSGSERPSSPASGGESPRAVSLPEVGSGRVTALLPPLVSNSMLEGDGGGEEEEDDTFGVGHDGDGDVVLDAEHDSDSSGESCDEDEQASDQSPGCGQDRPPDVGGGAHHHHHRRRRRRDLLLEFPAVEDEWSLFPATVMQEHALIDVRLAVAQQRTLRHLDPSSASSGGGGAAELCAGVDNVVRSFAIRGPLDCRLLERAVADEAAKRPLLRVVFHQYREQLFCRAAKDQPAFHLEHVLSGNTSEAIGDARRQPFHVHLYPLHREEVEREGLLIEAVIPDEETSSSFMQGRRLGNLSEDGGDSLKKPPGSASRKHSLRRSNALRSSGVATFSSHMSIIDLEDVQVNSVSRARRLGSALKRRPSSSVIHISRSEGLNEIAEQQQQQQASAAISPLSSRQIPSLLSIAGVGLENGGTESSSKVAAAPDSRQRAFAASQSTLSGGLAGGGAGSSKSDIAAVLWLRAKVISTSTQEHLLVLSAPPFVCDYWSLSMLVVGVCDAYTALERQQALAAGDKRNGALVGGKRASRARTMNGGGGKAHGASAARGMSRQAAQRQGSLAEHYARPMVASPTAAAAGLAGPCVRFQEVAMREAEALQLRPRTKLWELWEGHATLTVLTRQGQRKSKPAPALQLPFHVRGETARRTALLRSARTRTGACTAGGAFTSFKFLKLDESVTEQFQRNLPASVWQRISADNPLFLLSLALFTVLMGRCCRGWDGGGGNQRAPTATVSNGSSSSARLGTLSEASSSSSARRDARPPSSRIQQQANSRRYLNAAPPGAGYFLIGVPLQVRDLSPAQMATVFGPLTNDAALKVTLPAFRTFSELLVGLDRSVKSLRKQVHFPFSSMSDELGIRGGLPVSFSFLRRREVQCLTNPEAFYFTETAVGVPGQGLARFGSQCYLQPENGQLKEHCHLELLLWEMLENESVRGGFRYQPNLIRASLVEGLAAQLCHLSTVVAENPTIALSELAASINPPFLHRRASERQASASVRHR